MSEEGDSTVRRHDSRSEGNKKPQEFTSFGSGNESIPFFDDSLFGINPRTEFNPKNQEQLDTSKESNRDPSLTDRLQAKVFGRYKIEKILGEGGFGVVYLARDEELKRNVAIKVPREDAIFTLDDIEAYLIEAQILACLDHPNIVPVFDVGRTENGLPYIVSKFIEGGSLSSRTRDVPMSTRATVELVIRVADALQYAHDHGLVHRDVKPVNILLEEDDKPYLVDFGLAMREEDFGKGYGYSGTPAYMSPEQANGEGHLVDGRSDVFSLGVILYEQLTGEHPRLKKSLVSFLGSNADFDPKPLRQLNPAISVELERITLKAIAKRVSDRYSTAREFAEDLSNWLKNSSGAVDSLRLTTIVPKGLRSFEAEDTEFFPSLLPGPRGRDGLPESLRFWRNRIEERKPENSCAVGLIYGPSGCGKSSLVKAGLLPRLSPSVISIYLEATGADTESRLLNALRKQFKSVPEGAELKETLAAIRRGNWIPPGKKVLIVLDQFEQWLHASHSDGESVLGTALRQCDGSHLQALILVRDDFWLAITRFMRTLDIRLLEGQNSTLVDLFDLEHSRSVLCAFGRAFGKISPDCESANQDCAPFIDAAISGLAIDQKIIPVRLALFAEMLKDKPWTIETLKQVGGTEGVGVTFLEETFHSSTSPLENRYHQTAARQVLVSLLPEAGADIKGHMRSEKELLEASGYAGRPDDFNYLLQILDARLRLITPTDAGINSANFSEDSVQPVRHYQLTHDYLVPSLREWLTQKQKETRSGRAELMLSDLSSVWNSRRENRQLPSLLQWLTIRLLTQRHKWTTIQRKMMGVAGAYHSFRATLFMLGLVFISILAVTNIVKLKNERERLEASAKAARILEATPGRVETLIEEIGTLRSVAEDIFRSELDKPFNRNRKLNASLALVKTDPKQVPYLKTALLESQPEETLVIARALAPYQSSLNKEFWEILLDGNEENRFRRYRAAAALALFDGSNPLWQKAGRIVADDIVADNPIYLGEWAAAFRHLKPNLIPRLAEIYHEKDPDRKDERVLATNLLADYVENDSSMLVSLLVDADEKQFDVIFRKLKTYPDSIQKLKDIVFTSSNIVDQDAKEIVEKRRVNAVIGLLRQGITSNIWDLFKISPDSRFRSYFVHRYAVMGGNPALLFNELSTQKDASIRRTIFLTLGEFRGVKAATRSIEENLAMLKHLYETSEDGGEHSSIEWLLKQFQQQDWIRQKNKEWRADKKSRIARERLFEKPSEKIREGIESRWLVNGEGQTEIVIFGPRSTQMGSPKTEQGREFQESTPHRRRIGRSFSILSKPVTVEQYRAEFSPTHSADKEIFLREDDLPVGAVDWYQAAKYCNFLSKKEGIAEDQWCYEVQGNRVWPKKGYLKLKGYRLPSEAEIECVIRAGSTTSRFFGESPELLSKYAWFQLNADERTWPVGNLKPNDFGLFDAYGNVFTWCTERFKLIDRSKNEQPSEDLEDLSQPSEEPRIMKGGSFFFAVSDMRSASAYNYNPNVKFNSFGLRPVRTISE